jgi:chromosome segregation ATPase
MTIRDRLDEEAAELRTMRDELRVQMHLGKLDAKDQWEQLEKRWQHAEGKLTQLKDASRETAEDIAEATQLVLEEMREGYQRLRKLL